MNHWGLTIHSMSPWLSILNWSQIKGRILVASWVNSAALPLRRPASTWEIKGNWAANYWMVTQWGYEMWIYCGEVSANPAKNDTSWYFNYTLYVLLGMSIVFLHQMIEVRFASSYQRIKVWTSQRPSGGRNFTTYTRSASLRATFRRSISFEASEDLSWTMTTRVVQQAADLPMIWDF
jgi:hypothetical protein